MKYRRKPTFVEAYQVTREMAEGYLFDDKPLPEGLQVASASCNRSDRTIRDCRMMVTTIHGQTTYVEIGDWVATEPDGIHHYPIKPDIFTATYDPVYIEPKGNNMDDMKIRYVVRNGKQVLQTRDSCPDEIDPRVQAQLGKQGMDAVCGWRDVPTVSA